MPPTGRGGALHVRRPAAFARNASASSDRDVFWYDRPSVDSGTTPARGPFRPKPDMRKPLTFLLAATLILIAAVFWTVGMGPVVMGGKEIVGLARPGALPLLFAALALFAIALVVAFAAAVRAWMHRGSPAEPSAPPEERAPATG